MTTITDYPVTCSSCSLPTGERTDDRGARVVLGPCCSNLPRPWGRDDDGLFTVSRGIESTSIPGPGNQAVVIVPDEVTDDDPEDDHRPRCAYCGSFSFRAYETSIRTYHVDTEDYDYDRSVLQIPGDYETSDEGLDRIECGECGRTYRGEHERS